MATPRVAAEGQPVLSLRIKLNGPRSQVLADLDRLLALTEELPSVEIEGDLSLEPAIRDHEGAPAPDWPTYSNRLIRYAGRQASLAEQQGAVFEQLWLARGDVVPQRKLMELFPADQDQKQQVHTVICRLRGILGRTIPEVQIVTAGNGYHLSVALD